MAPRTTFSIRRTPVFRRIAAAVVAVAIVSGGAIASQAATVGDDADEQIVATVDGAPVTQAELDELIGQVSGERPAADDDGGEQAEAPDVPVEQVAAEEFDGSDTSVVEPAGPERYATGVPAPPEDVDASVAPPARANTANIRVRAVDHWHGTAQAVNAAGVEGVEFRLYGSESATQPLNGGAGWASARSDSDGWATFSGIPTEQYVWVRAYSAPNGWSINERFGTAEGAVTPNVVERAYQFRVPRTGSLTAHSPYVAGTDFMTAPSTGTQAELQTGSTGHFAMTRDNPPMPVTCRNLNIALLIDVSSSITSDMRPGVEAAVGTFLDQIADTEMMVQAFRFGTTASKFSSPLNAPVRADSLALTSTNADTPRNPWLTGTQWTNWDHALRLVDEQTTNFDLVIVFTDGLPTVIDGGGSGGGSRRTRFLETERAIFAANSLKASGSRIITVGFGPAGLSATARYSLAAISGQDAVYQGDWDTAAANLRRALVDACTPSLRVTKYEIPWSADATDTSARVAASGWEFTVSDVSSKSGGTFDPIGTNQTRVTGTDGSAAWLFEPETPDVIGTAAVTESQKVGFSLVQHDGFNAQCSSDRRDVVPVLNVDDGVAVEEIHHDEAVRCIFVNRRPGPVTLTNLAATGTYDVDYTWEITKQVRADAESEWVDEVTLPGVTPGGRVDVAYRLAVTAEREETHQTTAVSFDVTRPTGSTVGTEAVRVTVDDAEVYRVALSTFEPGATTQVDVPHTDLVVSGNEPATVSLYVDAVLIQSITVDPEPGTTTNATAELTDTFLDSFADVTAFADAFGEVTLNAASRRAEYTDQEVDGASVENPTEGGPLTWEFIYPATLDGPEHPGDEVTAANIAVVSPNDGGPDDDDNATVVVTTDPVGPHIEVVAGATYSTDFEWTIHKQVRVAGTDGEWLAAAEARTIPGVGVEFEYRLVVRADGTSTDPVIAGHVVLRNDNASVLTLTGEVVVDIGGVPHVLAGAGETIAARESTTVGFEVSLAHPEAWPLIVTATHGDAVHPVDVTPEVRFTNDLATVWDDFEEFAEAFPDGEAALDALTPGASSQWDETERAWVFTYTAVRGDEVPAGQSGTFVNTATVTPEGAEEPADEDDASVTVTTGLPLVVTGDGSGTLVRTYSWELVKQVQDVTGAWVDAATLPADDDGNAEFTFRVAVRPVGATDSNWEFTGSVGVRNPNEWPVTVRNITATIAGAGATPAEVTPDERAIAAGETIDLDLTAVLAEVDHEQFDSLTVSITWDQDEALSATRGDSAEIAVQWNTDHAPVNRVVHVYDDLAGTVDTPTRLGTIDWYADSTSDVTDVPSAVAVTLEDGAFLLTYTVTMTADEGELSASSDNRAWLTPGGDVPPLVEDATEQTVIRYDLAVRTWVNEIWRGGELVHTVTDAPHEGGPADPIPFTAYDADEDVRVGDVLVKPIVVINQGDERARVTEIVHWLPDATLELASAVQTRAAGHDDAGWVGTEDGRVARLTLAEPLDLAPGEWGQVNITLTVVTDPDAEVSTDGQVHVDAMAFAEIADFDGWVPAGTSQDGSDDAEAGGVWTSTAVDVDSVPNTADHLTDGLWDADAVTAIWTEIDNVVAGPTDSIGVVHEADSDDHDGEIVRVLVGLPLEAAVTVSGTNHVDYDWAITKDVTTDDDVETVAGEDVEFSYLITITSERQVENLEVTGSVSVTNPSSVEVDLDALSVMIGDEPALLDGVVTSVPGGGMVDVRFAATLDGNLVDEGLPLPVVATVVSLPDGQEATETAEAELNLDDVARTVTNQTAEVRDSFPEFAEQFGDANGEVWLDAADPEASETWNTEAGRWEFAYTAERGATVPDGGIETFVNVATVIPDPGTPPGVDWEDDQPADDLEDDAVVIVRTPVVYDLALRSWVAELHRPGVGRISDRLPSDLYPDHSGPEQPVPYVTYDNPYADVQVGDIMVSNIRVFNQGNRTARVDELVKYTYPGLALASPRETEIVPGHENHGWAIGASGDAYRTFVDGGIVLAPGEEFTVHVTQVVTSELFEKDGVDVVYDADGRPFREVLTFTEISSFSGWLHDEPVIATGDPLIGAFATGEMHDGAHGSWVTAEPGGLVEDIDSIPGTADHRVPFDETSVRWVDMEIHHSVGEQDEDDHDGAVIRVLDPEFVANELPDVRAATGGTVLDGSGRMFLVLAAAGLMVLAGLVLRRARNPQAG